MQPDAFLFKTTKEALDETIPLQRMWRNELLTQRVMAASGAKAPALKNQSVIAANYRCRTLRMHSSEACQTGLFERPLGFLGTTAEREFIAGQFPIVTVDNRS